MSNADPQRQLMRMSVAALTASAGALAFYATSPNTIEAPSVASSRSETVAYATSNCPGWNEGEIANSSVRGEGWL
jgi:hypothetical protein